MHNSSVFKRQSEGVLIQVKVTPNAAQNRIGPITQDDKGQFILKLFVTAVPESGKANEAVIRLLTKTWGLKKTQIQILHGLSDRNKTILITGKMPNLFDKLEKLI